ncbi:hypothetical protein H4R34_005831, partial [Dimargaris verticillata]
MALLRRNSLFDSSAANLSIDLLQEPLIMRGSKRTSPGCVLRGYVRFNPTESMRLRALLLCFKGVEKLNAVSATTEIVSQRTVFSHTWHFLPLSASYHIMAAGSYSYYFEVILPGQLPETVSVGQAQITYTLSALAIRPTFRKDIIVSRNVALQRYVLPDALYQTDSLVNHGCLGESALYRLRVPERRLGMGDNLAISIHIKYLTDYFVSKVWVVLVENVTYMDNAVAPPPETDYIFVPGHTSPSTSSSAHYHNEESASAEVTPDGSPASSRSQSPALTPVPTAPYRSTRRVTTSHTVKEVVDTKFPDAFGCPPQLKKSYILRIPKDGVHYDVETANVEVRHRIRMVFQMRNRGNLQGHVALSFSVKLLPNRTLEMMEQPPQYGQFASMPMPP